MNYFSVKNFIRFTIALAIMAMMFTTHHASADQYIYSGPHGNIVTDATLTPGSSPHVYGPGASFFALGQIISYSTVPETVNLTIQNNTGSVITLIPTQTIGAMGATYAYTHGDVTPSTPGTYAMNFVTGVDQAQNYSAFLGSVGNATTNSLACTTLSNSARPYYNQEGAPFPLTGQTIYDNFTYTIAVNGGSKWYHMLYFANTSNPQRYAVQISSSGVVMSYNHCQ
jgi:hypothetical protein